MRKTFLSQLASWAGGRREGGDCLVSGICTDSRLVRPGQAFLALRGPRHDGHRWLADAVSAGAVAAVIEESHPDPVPLPAVRVTDCGKALAEIARGYRRTLAARFLAVTGSNGKTTTKDMLARLLAAAAPTAAAPRSFNNRIGVPLTILSVEDSHGYAVLELGMNHPGEIRELTLLARPEVGIVTNIGPAHLGFLGSLEAVAAAKAELLESEGGCRTAVLNRDDPEVWAMRSGFSGTVVSFGCSRGCDVRLLRVRPEDAGQRLELEVQGAAGEMFLPVPGRHNALNFSAAVGAALAVGAELSEIQPAVAGLRLPAMRFETRRRGNVTVTNDAFNANPASMRSSLSAWLELPGKGRRILVGGDMRELGDFSQAEHAAWGREAARSGCDGLVFVGGESARAYAAAREEGFPAENLFHFERADGAGSFLRGYLEPGDRVLLKGSRLIGLEKILEYLPAEPGTGEK